MDNSKQIEGLERTIEKGNAIIQIYKSPQFQQYLLPALKELTNVASVDPSQYKDREHYQYDLMINNAKAFALKQFVTLLENQEAIITNASKQLYILKQLRDAREQGTTKTTS